MMQEQREYLDSNLKLLLVPLQRIYATTDKNCKEIKAIQLQFGDNAGGPHSKHQKHRNMGVEPAEVMENADPFCYNRDAHAPEPGGVEGP
eukprot:4544318-Ditylum_brightwellii.AAC.1